MRKHWSVGFREEAQVVGYNPENADYDHPRGEDVRFVWVAIATDRDGFRHRWDAGHLFTLEAIEQAYTLFAPPVELWEETYPEYGSRAYQISEPEIVAREREEDKRSSLNLY